jgi:hypothetical protein
MLETFRKLWPLAPALESGYPGHSRALSSNPTMINGKPVSSVALPQPEGAHQSLPVTSRPSFPVRFR